MCPNQNYTKTQDYFYSVYTISQSALSSYNHILYLKTLHETINIIYKHAQTLLLTVWGTQII